MRPDAAGVLNPPPEFNLARLDWAVKTAPSHALYEKYWEDRNYHLIPKSLVQGYQEIWLEIGAGTGHFFSTMATHHPDKQLIAIERCRMRAKTLVRKTKKLGLPNLTGLRGNAIPAIMTGVPDNRLERIYILYPCPWPKNRHCHNRWYLHPLMPHLVRTLKPGAVLIWASDQKFYIDEARYICESKYGMEVVRHGMLAPHSLNGLEESPEGRSKFERDFLGRGLPCHELIVRKR